MHLVHTFRVQLTRIPPIWCFFTLKKSIIKCTRATWLPPRDTGGTNPSSMERTPRMHRGGRMPGRASRAASRGKPRTASGLGRLPRRRSAPASQRPRCTSRASPRRSCDRACWTPFCEGRRPGLTPLFLSTGGYWLPSWRSRRGTRKSSSSTKARCTAAWKPPRTPSPRTSGSWARRVALAPPLPA